MSQNQLEKTIRSINETYPELLRAADLVRIGVFRSRSAVCIALGSGLAPPYLRLTKRRIVFPKSALCDWLSGKIEGGAKDESAQS
jgi:hypothetical protein